jgi:alkanesulfonate monooxygenase SsuD/methylene tetrahydromethanopterin reductase-like flavin-dependent oxidoreductase (luciferase family)
VDIGVGLPGTASDDDPRTFLEWARRAEARGFSSLGLVDRIVFPNYEPLVAFAAVAAVTNRIRLITSILIGPYRLNTALLAKQIATLDRLSRGRTVIGIGMGARADDYTASGIEPRHRARRLEEQIGELRRLWAGEPRGYAGAVGPTPTRRFGPELLIGGHVPAALRRAGQMGDGWMMGGGGPEQFQEMVVQVRAAWTQHGRAGVPRTAALAFFSLGPQAREQAESFLGRYYDFPPDAGDQALIDAAGASSLAEVIVENTAMTPKAVKALVDAWATVDCNELILLPCSSDQKQVDLLADSLGELLLASQPEDMRIQH